MYITEDELKKRLNKTELQIQKRERLVRGEEKRLTHEDRVVIGVLEELDTQKNIAELLGVSQMTVSNASRGITSPTIGVDKELSREVRDGKERIEERVKENNRKIEDQLLTNLASALGQIANNIHTTDAVEASKVAVDMSKILDRVNGSRGDGKDSRTAIIINVPTMKKEESYQVINV